tara:strand:+ start:123 stop:1160 length:1038 start_codon:yes stop_codon:yes gene_type:complete
MSFKKNINSFWSGSCGPLLIAEIGGNHEGNFDEAKRLTKLAIKSSADCIKFQLYKGDSLVNHKLNPKRNKHFKKFELSKKENLFLADMCKEANVIYNASVWDLEMLDWIDSYLTFYKVGSGDMTAFPIIKEFVLRRKPILLSTGLSKMDEVLETVDYIKSLDKKYDNPEMLCILQCTSMYPIPESESNLEVMSKYKSLLGSSIGYSDHTVGSYALKNATIMGANVLEFHFTDSRKGKKFRDHQVSLTCDEVIELKKDIKRIYETKGDGIKKPQQSEIESQHIKSFRRGVYLKKQIKKGDIIKREDLIFLRPNIGTHSKDFELVIGSKASKNIEPFDPIFLNIDYK